MSVREDNGLGFTSDEIETIKNTVAKEATDTELKLFLHQCKRTGLDPFSRQIYFIKLAGKPTMQSSIDGFRLIAERSGKYQGQTIPLYMTSDGAWVEVWNETGYPVAAKVGVYRSDFKEPLYGIAKWTSYVPMYNGKVGNMWAKMPEVMLAKVAEALALRKAFPNDLSGLYAAEEMQQATAEPTVRVMKHIQHDEDEPVVVLDDPAIHEVKGDEELPERELPLVRTVDEYKEDVVRYLGQMNLPNKTKAQVQKSVWDTVKLEWSPENVEEIAGRLSVIAEFDYNDESKPE